MTQPLPRWAWGKSLGAAAWPLLCAALFAAYAFFPDRFPAQTATTLMLLMAAEIPALAVGLAYAAALGEATVAARLKMFFICIGTLALVAVLNLGLNFDFVVVAPILLWVLVPNVIELWHERADRVLASRQAAAVVEDRMHLFALLPTLVVFGVLFAIGTLLLLGGISIATGSDLVGRLAQAVDSADPALLALIGSAYMLLGAASAAHVHRPVFLRDRKRLLDRPWLHKITLRK
jgi:hypothetical protein